jgi:hypothetical protein
MGREDSDSTKGGDTTLQDGLDKVDKMITWGKRAGYEQASINLQNWRDRKGDRVMPADSFQSEKFLLEHLKKKHRPKFIEGAKKRISSKSLTPGGRAVEMDWTDSVVAPFNTDLFFALGGFTVHSHVKVELEAGSGGSQVLSFGLWETDISDVYDWDPGKSTAIPGIGKVTDDEMRALEKAGYGKSFKVTSQKAKITDKGVTGDETLK